METSNSQETIINITSKGNTATRDDQPHNNTLEDKGIKRKSSTFSQDVIKHRKLQTNSEAVDDSITESVNSAPQPAPLHTLAEQESMVLPTVNNTSEVDSMERTTSLLSNPCAQSNDSDIPNGNNALRIRSNNNGSRPIVSDSNAQNNNRDKTIANAIREMKSGMTRMRKAAVKLSQQDQNNNQTNASAARTMRSNVARFDSAILKLSQQSADLPCRNQEQIDQMQTSISTLNEKIETSVSNLSNKIDSLLSDNTKQVYEHKSSIERVTNSLATVSRKVDLLSESIEQIPSIDSISTIQGNIDHVRNQNIDLRQKYNSLLSDVTALQEQNTQLQRRYEELQKQYEDSASLVNEAGSVQQERGQLQQQRNNLQNVSQVSQEPIENPLFISMQPGNTSYNTPYYTPYRADDNYYNYNYNNMSPYPPYPPYSAPPARNVMMADTTPQVNITPHMNQGAIPIGEARNSADYYQANTIVASQVWPSQSAGDNYNNIPPYSPYPPYSAPPARNVMMTDTPQVNITPHMNQGAIPIGGARNVNPIAASQVQRSYREHSILPRH